MRRNRRQPFVITVAVVASATVFACGGNTSKDSGSGGTGSSGGSGGTGNASGSGGSSPGCPSELPASGTSCSLPTDSTCSYTQGACCPPWEATCADGVWQAYGSSCNPPAPAPCPDTVPANGSACGSAGQCGIDYTSYCSYDICSDGTASITAECNGLTWTVTQQKQCTAPACETLTACECFASPDCVAVADGCLCPCDFQCQGEPPCACDCGGGTYLGCEPSVAD